MEGLVDYVKRQVKCPECRAEHRIPYNGIEGFPTNYTLQVTTFFCASPAHLLRISCTSPAHLMRISCASPSLI
jgi:hypothetical protein